MHMNWFHRVAADRPRSGQAPKRRRVAYRTRRPRPGALGDRHLLPVFRTLRVEMAERRICPTSLALTGTVGSLSDPNNEVGGTLHSFDTAQLQVLYVVDSPGISDFNGPGFLSYRAELPGSGLNLSAGAFSLKAPATSDSSRMTVYVNDLSLASYSVWAITKGYALVNGTAVADSGFVDGASFVVAPPSSGTLGTTDLPTASQLATWVDDYGASFSYQDNSNLNFYVSFPPLILAATSLQWNSSGGVDLSYTVTGTPINGVLLPRPTTVALYWADGPNFATSKTQFAYSVPIINATGTQSVSVTAAELGTPMRGSKDLILVVDPAKIEPAHEANSTLAVGYEAPRDQLVVTIPRPSSVVAGGKFEVQVAAKGANGSVDSSFTGPVSIDLSDNPFTGPSGANLGGTLTVDAVNGVADFPDLTVDKPGQGYFLTATSPNVSPANTTEFTIGPTAQVQPGSLSWDTVTGGFDYSYQISGVSLPGPLPIAFYWAPTTSVPTNTQPFYTSTTQTAIGSYGPIDVPSASMTTPPSGTNYLLEVTDPDHALSDDGSNHVVALSVPSTQDIVANSVTVTVNGPTVEAEFLPTSVTLDTAARLSGFDHFNWLQVVRHDPHPPPGLNAPYIDPPVGGGPAFGGYADDLPFYWDEGPDLNPLYHLSTHTHPSPAAPNYSLDYSDTPQDRLMAGEHIDFTTSLVGVTSKIRWRELYTFTWSTTYNGTTGGVS